MIVLHAIWDYADSAQLHIWAESSRLPITANKRAGKSTTNQKPQKHPFALAQDALRETLGELAGSLLARNAAPSTLTLSMPSTTKGPMPSPELILEKEEELQATAFNAWHIPTLTLDANFARDFLLALPDNAPRGMAFGSSLRFWATAASFSFELAARQCYMPGLQVIKRKRETIYRAIWDVALSPEDTERMHILSRMMPPICHAYLPPGHKKTTLPAEMLLHFLNHTIDAFVRARISPAELLPASKNRSNKTLSLPRQWLYALASDDPTLTAPAQELKQFADTMSAWLGQLLPGASHSPFRTCFRLEAPLEDNEGNLDWHVSFLLQANDDRSLLVPAENVWKERSSTLTFLKRQFENPQERLLADLGKASRLFPAIEEGLKTARPEALKLTTQQAYTFLRESAPLLEQSGFGVLVPPWWQKPAARLGVKLKIKGTKTSSGLLGLQSLVNYDWTISVGGTTLSATEFENLVNLKLPLIKVRGQWVELRPEEIEKAIAFFQKKRRNGNMTLGEALRTGLGQETSEVGLPVTEIEGEDWITDLLGQLSGNAKISTIKTPSTFHGKLRPYQIKGVSWLAFLTQFGFGSCLADDMGLGKCLVASSLVTTNGLLQKAEDIWNRYAGETMFDSEGYWADPSEKVLVNSIDEATGHIVQAPIKRLYRQHVSEQLRTVRLEDGSSVTITYPHKLLTDQGWTNDLHVGDYVCVPAKLIWDGKPEDPDLVKFLAWQISEGYEVKGQNAVRITQKDTAILEELRQCIQRLGERNAIKINCPSIHTYKDRSSDLQLTSVAYRRFLEAKGYRWGKLSNEKRIPDFVMQADLDSIRIFLRNFFEAEASAIESMRSVEISTASPLLIQQLAYLLRRFGIWMRVSTKLKRATNGSGIFRPYYFGVLGGNAARKFCQEIGFVSERKWTVQTLAAYAQLDMMQLAATRTQLQRLIDQEVYYCKIKEIEEVQYDGWVYDFEVANHHNFVANNILCHNTIQLITLLLHDRESANGASQHSPTLLICPMSIVGNWHREVQRFAPSLKVMIHHGHERLSGEAFAQEAKQHDIVITTYALALRDKEHLSLIDWEYVVVDEAQNIKNESAKQTQAIKSINGTHKIALTGTPVENRLSELWSIMEFLNPGYLGSAKDFSGKFAVPIEKYHDADRAETLKKVIQPFVLRRLKTDKSIISDLPDKMEMKVYCNLTQEQASLYEAVVKEMMEKIEAADGIERKGLVLSTIMKLKQICNHPAHFVADGSSLPGRSGKLARLEEMLEEVLAAGDKALIFSQFAEMGGMLRQYLQETLGCEVLFLHGGTSKKQRDLMVQRFQSEQRGAPLFILSLKAGGVGLNLTAANHVFHFDRWWNPAVENQATDRAFRIGQTKNVQVHKFISVGTMEERIDQMIEQKKVLAESIVGAGENWLTELSTAQLKDLFALSREAVAE
jgi:SNF2 family DNA or RNA helicase